MKEAMQDDFRQWYMEYKRVKGAFPEFPEDSIWQRPGFRFTTMETDLAARSTASASATNIGTISII